MCDDNDLEGARLWFYGGTPPMDETGADEHETHASPSQAWSWPPPSHQPLADSRHELAAA